MMNLRLFEGLQAVGARKSGMGRGRGRHRRGKAGEAIGERVRGELEWGRGWCL